MGNHALEVMPPRGDRWGVAGVRVDVFNGRLAVVFQCEDGKWGVALADLMGGRLDKDGYEVYNQTFDTALEAMDHYDKTYNGYYSPGRDTREESNPHLFFGGDISWI